MAEEYTARDSSASTAIVAIIVLAILGLAIWFGIRGNNPGIPNTGDQTNVELNAPVNNGGGGALDDALDPDAGSGAGATY